MFHDTSENRLKAFLLRRLAFVTRLSRSPLFLSSRSKLQRFQRKRHHRTRSLIARDRRKFVSLFPLLLSLPFIFSSQNIFFLFLNKFYSFFFFLAKQYMLSGGVFFDYNSFPMFTLHPVLQVRADKPLLQALTVTN